LSEEGCRAKRGGEVPLETTPSSLTSFEASPDFLRLRAIALALRAGSRFAVREDSPPNLRGECHRYEHTTVRERELPRLPGPIAAGGRAYRHSATRRHSAHRDAGGSSKHRSLVPRRDRL